MAQSTVLLRNPVDTHAASLNASRNWAGNRKLRIESGAAYAYLFFNRTFPLGATIVSATLRVYTASVWNSTPTLTVRRVGERWGVNRLNWNNRPAIVGPAFTKSQSSAAVDQEWAIDVTQMMQNVADGGIWFGLRIDTTDTGTNKYLWSSNGPADTRPQLEVVWSAAPQAPTSLTPSGSQVVGISKPILRFDFTDSRGSTALAAVQVQIDPNGNWTTPAFDSGTVTATEPELDLSTTAYAGLTAGQETRWRVRVQDGAGLWSEWSDVVRFRRDNKGTLSITNPAAAPNDFVSEWTPPIIWSLTGETQKAWRVFVTPADEPGTRLHDTGWNKGADTSWTLPKGVLEDDSRYRVVVRVRDSKDRTHTPTDRAYTQAEREFDFREDPTPNPVANLTVANLLPRPWAELTWTRSTAPDSFTIKRNGRVIETGIDPADVLVSGTTYKFTDRDARPYRTHTWVVQATVNGKTSQNNPSVSEKLQTQGIWLYDHDRNIEVFIAGRDEGAWAMGEEATTHNPVGSSKGVRITQAMRGFEGQVSGLLVDHAGKTAEAWENNLWKIKERPGRVVTLTLGNEAFRCVVGNIVSAPTASVPASKRVSFDFWQVGRLPFDPRW